MAYPTTDDELAAQTSQYWNVIAPIYDYGTLTEDREIQQQAGDFPMDGVQTIGATTTIIADDLLLLGV